MGQAFWPGSQSRCSVAVRRPGSCGGRKGWRGDGWVSLALQAIPAPWQCQLASSRAGGVCTRTGHPLRLQVPRAPRRALVPPVTESPQTLSTSEARPSSVLAHPAAAQGREVPAWGFGGGSAAQGASERASESPKKLVFLFARRAAGLIQSFLAWHQGNVSSC